MSNGGLPGDFGAESLPAESPPEKRTRSRRKMRSEKRRKIFERVKAFYDRDLESRSVDRELRLQRYAKFRQWTSGRDWPWPDASDLAMPDIATSVLRTEDTLHNAVMSNRPAVVSAAMEQGDEEKQTALDELHDFQFFAEQNGEKVVEELVDQFVKEGCFTAFIPWVKERRRIDEVRIFAPLDPEKDVMAQFELLLRRSYPEAQFLLSGDRNGWDWEVIFFDEGRESPGQISFYTTSEDELEMVIRRDVVVFDGPKVIVPAYEDVLTPTRVANLQAPGPSNPQGSPHVILIDRPTVDEIRRLQKSGFYDLLTQGEAESVGDKRLDDSDASSERQRDTIAGHTLEPRRGDESGSDKPGSDPTRHAQETVTRLTCFDLYDLDGDGRTEDVIFWVLLEPELLLKARHLTEMYPANPPRRPFAEASFLPVKGRREGIGLIELLEKLSEWKKVIADLMVDSGTLTNIPFFFYRPSSGLNPETFRPWPGDGIPLNDPKNDVQIPQFPNNTQAWAINLMAIVTQMEERLDLVGDLQLGRVPAGKSSALRTTGNVSMILSQSEARPERILRRFFMGLTEIYQQMHELNQRYLSPKKKFRILGALPQGEDPYRTIESTDEIRGRFTFGFDANVLNSSKQALQQSIQTLIATYVNELTLRTGIVTPDGVYRLFRDYGKALGQQPDKYLQPPTPTSRLMKLNAEQAITMIAQGATSFAWTPTEGPEVHLRKLEAFIQSDELGNLDPPQIEVLRKYLGEVTNQLEAEKKIQRATQAASQLSSGMGGGGALQGGGDRGGPTMIGKNELLPEDLPSSGGGANPGAAGGQ